MMRLCDVSAVKDCEAKLSEIEDRITELKARPSSKALDRIIEKRNEEWGWVFNKLIEIVG